MVPLVEEKWPDFIHELKETGINIENIQDYIIRLNLSNGIRRINEIK